MALEAECGQYVYVSFLLCDAVLLGWCVVVLLCHLLLVVMAARFIADVIFAAANSPPLSWRNDSKILSRHILKYETGFL